MSNSVLSAETMSAETMSVDVSYRVEQRDGVGRCLVADRTIEPLELILSDSPAATGPICDLIATCVSCYNVCREQTACALCRLTAFCSVECAQADVHRANECQLLVGVPTIPVIELKNSLLPLRLLLLRDSKPDRYSAVTSLMDHNDVRRKNRDDWRINYEPVVNTIRHSLNLAKRFSEEEINTVIGIIRTNSLELKILDGGSAKCRGVLPALSLMSHSCVCNARCVQRDAFAVDIRAQRRIERGEEITIQYTSLLSATRRRRALLSGNWCFECCCTRCADPAEAGSFVGALLCDACHGPSLPQRPLDLRGSDYKCVDCGLVLDGCKVKDCEARAEASLDNEQAGGARLIAAIETFLDKWKGVLHPHHFLMMRAKSQLISSYGNIPGFLYHQLSTSALLRKKQLCQEFFEVFSLVDPGATDWRGSTLFECAMTEMSLSQRCFDEGRMSAADFQKSLQAIVAALDEARQTLDVEEEGTYGKDLSVRAARIAADTRDLIRFSEFL